MVVVLVISLLTIPFAVKELYPFSLPTMFSVAPRQLARYTIRDREGREVDSYQVSLYVPEWHDPPVRTLGRQGYGRRMKPSVHVIGDVASAQVIEDAVRHAWSENPDLPDTLVVRQEVFTRGELGSIRQVADNEWTWSRPSRPLPRSAPIAH